MDNYLVDVPVRINIWIRPECQRKQWEIVRKAKPSIIFLQSDGGRNEKEWNAIYQNRKMIDESIDWNCTVYRLYEDHNNGLYAMGKKSSALIWSKVDRCIFTEDDQLMSVSFFRFCAEMLEKYKDDQRIECVCGMNHLGKSDDVNSDYFFSRQGSIWGTATWKRVVQERGDFTYGLDPYTLNLLRQRTKHNKIAWKRLNAYSLSEKYEGHVAGGEFWVEFDMYAQNRLQIIPKVNLISNIGATNDAEHSTSMKYLPKIYKKIFFTQVYEMEFPLKENKYVIPDVEYEKKRNWIMAYNHSFLAKWRKFIMLLKLIGYGRFDLIFKKLQRNKKGEK